MSVVEQRYHAVMEVAAGASKTEVAARYGVSRQSVHAWVRRYEEGGLAGLSDRSHRPRSHPWQMPAGVEAAVLELRRLHPKWGQRRLRHELARRGVEPVPSEASVYRILVRHQLIVPVKRRRRREDYRRWERPGPMQLWQLDVMGGFWLADGRELKLVTGVDDHSRFCVIAAVVERATGRAVCAAFAAALMAFGCPEEVLTDNGKQFTGRFGTPGPSTEVLFDRICRLNGIKHRLTKPRSPTTTGKIERFHQSLRRELLDEQGPFADLHAAQALIDGWREDYNTVRPHQSLDMATPASRFRAAAPDGLELRLPAQLTSLMDGLRGQRVEAVGEAVLGSPDAVEVDRVVPPSGNLAVAGQQFWFGPRHAGRAVTLWMDSTTVHVSLDGKRIKTVPSRLSTADLVRLRASGARAAGPAPAGRAPGRLAVRMPIEVARTVNASGVIGLAGQQITVGYPLAGQRVVLRLDGPLMQVIADGMLVRTMSCPVPPARRAYISDAQLSPLPPKAPQDAVRVGRKVSARGSIQVCGQQVQVGMAHARTVVSVEVTDTTLHVFDQDGHRLRTVPRTTSKEVTRFKAYGTKNRTTG
ncbi:IS481 family transposase [Streptomyces sp. NPDC001797]|uniref:IS481 family transposase n=1 Tax=Streptomyces sp. NPDC001797 TaxID=3364610 RepID=UPI0036C82E95